MNKKILVVDDDPDILEAMRTALEFEGYDVVATGKTDDIEKLPDGDGLPDLIILDILLSGKDGRSICRSIKQKRLIKGIPILMISAHPDAKSSAMQCGANDFIAKPFSVEDLTRRIENLLA